MIVNKGKSTLLARTKIMKKKHPLYRLTDQGLHLVVSTLVERTKTEYGGVLQDAIAGILFEGDSTEAFSVVNDFIEAAEKTSISLEGITTYNEEELVRTLLFVAVDDKDFNGDFRKAIQECIARDWTEESLTEEVNRLLELAKKHNISIEGILV